MNITAIYRAEWFSPNAVEKDRAILDAVIERLKDKAVVTAIHEEELLNDTPLPHADLYLSMARSEEVLNMLDGKNVINSSKAIRRCNHRKVNFNVNSNDNSAKTTYPLWLKRADGKAHEDGDVVFCKDASDKEKTIEQFKQRGITEWTEQPHYKGEEVKFYAVGDGFFWPQGQKITQGGLSPMCKLRQAASEMAHEIGLTIYGGDAVIGHDGEVHIIDLNDWPSFSACREEAAGEIERLRD